MISTMAIIPAMISRAVTIAAMIAAVAMIMR